MALQIPEAAMTEAAAVSRLTKSIPLNLLTQAEAEVEAGVEAVEVMLGTALSETGTIPP